MLKKTAKTRLKPGNFLLKSIISLAFFAFVVYGLVSIISIQATLSQKNEELQILQTRAANLQEKNDEYQRLLSVADDKEYMEKVAIEKLGYAFPSEIRFYDTSRG